jgi:hypothetical protein
MEKQQTRKNIHGNDKVSTLKIMLVGLLVGFLLNVTGWLGNNILLKDLWVEVGEVLPKVAWRENILSDIFSLAPDFLYGFAIAWLCTTLKTDSYSTILNSIRVGIFVSLVGGITTYFAIANSGFIPWKLALASFFLVVITKLPLAILAGRMLKTTNK